MKAPSLARYPAIQTSVRAVMRGLRFLSDLRALFRSSPLHTQDEQNAIRGLASIHPAIPRKVARVRSRLVDRRSESTATDAGKKFLFSRNEMQKCVDNLDESGVPIFGDKLPATLVSELQDALKALPAYLRTEDGSEVPFRPGEDTTGLFDIREHDLMSPAVLQEYATNPTWDTIAASYFRAPPVNDEIVAWWTFPQSARFASLNAQLFHSDRRRLSFVKFFTYLTDVTTKNGPHVVVPRSHRERPFSLRADRRYEDAEIAAAGAQAPLEVLGQAGTVIAVDTQALHKGKTLEEGHRLIFEIQLATDLLGPPSAILHNDWSDLVRTQINANARLLQRFQ